MKRLLITAVCIILTLFCFSASACGQNESENNGLFVFLSVRMKGNGDGTLTAVAKNEFAIGNSAVPITLKLFYSENQTDISAMNELESVFADGLKIFETAEIDYEISEEGFYCARIIYAADGEERFLQSATIYYDTSGTRIQHTDYTVLCVV